MTTKYFNKIFILPFKGTGKSFLMDTICKKLNATYQNPENPNGWIVAVLAPTGLAAYNVNGLTIHRFFKLPIFLDNNEKHWPLSDGNLKLIRSLLPNLKLIIIGNLFFVKIFKLKFLCKSLTMVPLSIFTVRIRELQCFLKSLSDFSRYLQGSVVIETDRNVLTTTVSGPGATGTR